MKQIACLECSMKSVDWKTDVDELSLGEANKYGNRKVLGETASTLRGHYENSEGHAVFSVNDSRDGDIHVGRKTVVLIVS